MGAVDRTESIIEPGGACRPARTLH